MSQRSRGETAALEPNQGTERRGEGGDGHRKVLQSCSIGRPPAVSGISARSSHPRLPLLSCPKELTLHQKEAKREIEQPLVQGSDMHRQLRKERGVGGERERWLV